MHFSSGITPITTAARAGSGGGGDYHADAVHFGGAAFIEIESLSVTDGPAFTRIFWFKGIDPSLSGFAQPTLAVVDPENNYINYFDFKANPTLPDIRFRSTLLDSGFTGTLRFAADYTLDTAWHSIITSAETNFGAGLKRVKIYLDDIDVTQILNDSDDAFTPSFNGFPYYLGNDTFNDFITGDFADFRTMPGVSLLDAGGDIPVATRRLFVTADNKPVDPATATAALGAPTILFSGNATGFAINRGTGGPAVLTGSLTNASTSPSD